MEWNRLYLPQATAFGWFRGQLLHELDRTVVHHLAHRSQEPYLGLLMDWVTGYCGWMPFTGAKIELHPDGRSFDIVLSFTPGVLPVSADAARFLEFVRILREAGAIFTQGSVNREINAILDGDDSNGADGPPSPPPLPPLPPDGCVRGL